MYTIIINGKQCNSIDMELFPGRFFIASSASQSNYIWAEQKLFSFDFEWIFFSLMWFWLIFECFLMHNPFNARNAGRYVYYVFHYIKKIINIGWRSQLDEYQIGYPYHCSVTICLWLWYSSLHMVYFYVDAISRRTIERYEEKYTYVNLCACRLISR